MSKSFSTPGILSISSSLGWKSFDSPKITFQSKAKSDNNLSGHPIRTIQKYKLTGDILETDFANVANLESVMTEKQDIFVLADSSIRFKQVKVLYGETRERQSSDRADKIIFETSTEISGDVTSSLINLLLVTGSFSNNGVLPGFGVGWSGSESGSFPMSASVVTGSSVAGFTSAIGNIQRLADWPVNANISTTIPVPLIGDVFFTFSFHAFTDDTGGQDFTLFIRLLDSAGATQREALKTWTTGSQVDARVFMEAAFYNVLTQITQIQVGFTNTSTQDELYIDNAQLEHGLLTGYTTK